jgi:hypothetical protein
MFFSGLPGFNYTVAPCWDEARSLTTWRSYNYPHVTIVYWSLYRAARNYGDVSGLRQDWQWYLGQAVNTTLLGVAKHGRYNGEGLMAGSVWRLLLHDLKREGAAAGQSEAANADGKTEARRGGGEESSKQRWLDAAAQIEAFMRGRAEGWAKEPFPFGSEMPWDSTGQVRETLFVQSFPNCLKKDDAFTQTGSGTTQQGKENDSKRSSGVSHLQEEVFGWSREFGIWGQSNATLAAVLAYAPRLPSWAYHGNARRYFDFLVYGSPQADTGTEVRRQPGCHCAQTPPASTIRLSVRPSACLPLQHSRPQADCSPLCVSLRIYLCTACRGSFIITALR